MGTVAPFVVNARLDAQIEGVVGAGENHHVPIGALAVFQIVVTVNGKPAPVSSSNWSVKGPQIVPGSVMQTAAKGSALIQVDRKIAGGYAGDKSCIATAWSEPGTFAVTISGEYRYKKGYKSFRVSGTVSVHAPLFNLAESSPHIDQPTFDEGKLTAQFGTTSVGYTCNGVTVGGVIGFLQIIDGLRLRGPGVDQPTQSMGSRQDFLDYSNGAVFYASETALYGESIDTNDSPSLLCDGEPYYTWYRVGDLHTSENFFMYLAYKAPVTNGIVESYIVVNAVCRWNWSMVGVYDDKTDEWGPDPDATNWDSSGWDKKGWSMPLWTGNSLVLRDWQPYHPA